MQNDSQWIVQTHKRVAGSIMPEAWGITQKNAVAKAFSNNNKEEEIGQYELTESLFKWPNFIAEVAFIAEVTFD